MPWTVTELEHWQERLARLLDRQLQALSARDPTLRGRLRARARQLALQSLGLAEMQAELDAVAAQAKELRRRRRQALRAMRATVRRVPLEEVGERPGRGAAAAVARALRRRQAAHEEELLAEDELGREILSLRREQEALRDTVWLAACPAAVQALWQRACALLGHEPTPLQRQALGGAAGEGPPA
jgi:hypothetical protein